ncbi:MAG: NAD-dependent epimerase/dehydratase family protein [Elusimicrobiota bacterium]|jgi:nucleoside-diphosphate-sugar epimerase|nr:NAD-dependent epimerase/dehydratase family protein [Elusimicrobiota bacterium]
MKKAIITGGRGFIGAKLAEKLAALGYEVKIFSRRANAADARVAAVNYGDVENLAAAMRGAHIIFHLAAVLFAYNKEEFYKGNAEVTKNLALAAAKAGGIEKFVYLSSQAAAGPSEYRTNPRREEDVEAPVSDYGITKLEGERVLAQNLPPEIKHVILRAPVVYGRDDSGVSKIASFVRSGVMVNTSSGATCFNFIYADDLIEALVTAATDGRTDNQTYFVCENKNYNWEYFINAMARAMGKPAPFMFTLPYFMLEVIAFIYSGLARIFNFTPALNYDKVKEAAIKGHWVCNPNKWISLTEQKFTPLEEGLLRSYK